MPGLPGVSTSVKGWVLTRPKDVPCGGMAVVMQWRKRRWRCRMQDCPQQTFTEAVGQLPAGMRTTTRLREGLARAVADGRDQSEVAAAHGVSWPTVARALVDYAHRELAEPEPTTVLGRDETGVRPAAVAARGQRRPGPDPVAAHRSVGDRVR